MQPQMSPIDDAENGNLSALQSFIGGGGDLYTANKHNETLLHRASSKGHKDCVDWLLAQGADPNKKSNVRAHPPVGRHQRVATTDFYCVLEMPCAAGE